MQRIQYVTTSAGRDMHLCIRDVKYTVLRFCKQMVLTVCFAVTIRYYFYRSLISMAQMH
jgi:hypothetical protein